jgi:hypothetical protein
MWVHDIITAHLLQYITVSMPCISGQYVLYSYSRSPPPLWQPNLKSAISFHTGVVKMNFPENAITHQILRTKDLKTDGRDSMSIFSSPVSTVIFWFTILEIIATQNDYFWCVGRGSKKKQTKLAKDYRNAMLRAALKIRWHTSPDSYAKCGAKHEIECLWRYPYRSFLSWLFFLLFVLSSSLSVSLPSGCVYELPELRQ